MMAASSPNTGSLPVMVASTTPPVLGNGAGPFKRKADDLSPPSTGPPGQHAVVFNNSAPAAAIVTPRASTHVGNYSEIAISLDSSDDENNLHTGDTAEEVLLVKSTDTSAAPTGAAALPTAALAPPVASISTQQHLSTNGAGVVFARPTTAANNGTSLVINISKQGEIPPVTNNGAWALEKAPAQADTDAVGSTTVNASSSSTSASAPSSDSTRSGANNVPAFVVSGSHQASVPTAGSTGNVNVAGNGEFYNRNATNPPKPKRRVGRPLGSKNKKFPDDDEPYVAHNSSQPHAGFVSNVATRPRRTIGRRQRWADEMANPGDQWLRKVSLPPNPVDANFEEAPTFYPTAEEFRDPLSYIESIRPAAEDFGIAKIVPPSGWKPPETPMTDHINKLLPTKKQALHSLMDSEEVYDDGDDFTIREYKNMADEFALKWSRREQPLELSRRNPRRVKAGAPGYAFTPIPFPVDVKCETATAAVKAEQPAHLFLPASQPLDSARGHVEQQGQHANGAHTNGNATVVGEAAKTQPPPYPATQCTPNAARAMAAAAAAAGGGGGQGVQPPDAAGQETICSLPTAVPEVEEFTEERLRELEREYWNIVDGGAEEAEVEYANDLDISEFWSGFPLPPENFMDGSSFDRTKSCNFDDPKYYRTCGWNLNNLPFWPGSVLRFFRTHVNGLTAPWLYLGMQFATFAWHNEDNYLYSLNYHHSGAPKQWYGVPGKFAQGFEECLARMLGETLETVSEHLYRITKMLSPVYLQNEKVPVCKLRQEAGQFVVTFPKAYHGGFSYGFNCGEAVNFAVPDWISYSRESTEAYRQASRKAALSHDKMVATLTMYLPDHDVKGCELVVAELKRIQSEELNGRRSLELEGAQDPSKAGLKLPRFSLGLIDQDTEEYDERRMCKTCKHTLFMTGVACRCNDLDVSCLRCVKDACNCPMTEKYLLSWWTEEDLSKFVSTAEIYLHKLKNEQANEAAVKAFNDNIDPF